MKKYQTPTFSLRFALALLGVGYILAGNLVVVMWKAIVTGIFKAPEITTADGMLIFILFLAVSELFQKK